MRTTIYTIVTLVLIYQQSLAQTPAKITGPLGVYHASPGFTYKDSTGKDSTEVQYEFRFGELAICNQAVDDGFVFVPDIDSCVKWNANKVIGIIQPPTEQGVANQPADTSLYYPYPQSSGPGMIQGAHRFSQLSQLYGPFCGIILDDWNRDTALTHKVHDALLGKYVDATGKVYSNTAATTPYNKLYCVIYDTLSTPSALPFIDGVSYWYITDQNCCYYKLDGDVSQLRIGYPHKEILVGIYINGVQGWMDPTGIEYMLEHSLNRYDDGDINGITIYAGVQLVKDFMPLGQWDSIALPFWLDSLYFLYLGEGQGQLFDCITNTPLADAFVRVYCKGRISGDTLLRSRQRTDPYGKYQFGLWAGNRNTDSTYYWLVAEKAGYINDTIGFWVKRKQTTPITGLSLCASNQVNNTKDKMYIFPNPGSGLFTIDIYETNVVNGVMEIYDMLGKKVYSGTQALSHSVIDMSAEPDGIYFIRATSAQAGINAKGILDVQR